MLTTLIKNRLDSANKIRFCFIFDMIFIISILFTLVILSFKTKELDRDQKLAVWLGFTFPFLGILNVWPAIETEDSVLKCTLFVSFTIGLLWWSVYLYFYPRYRKYLSEEDLDFLFLASASSILWFFILNTIIAAYLGDDYENCMYARYYHQPKCWKLSINEKNTTWIKDNSCAEEALSISTAFWFSIVGGFSGIKMGIEYEDYREVCQKVYGHSMRPFYISFFYICCWGLIYIISPIYAVLKIFKNNQNMEEEPPAYSEVIEGEEPPAYSVA